MILTFRNLLATSIILFQFGDTFSVGGNSDGKQTQIVDAAALGHSLIENRRADIDATRASNPDLFRIVEPFLHLETTVGAPTSRRVQVIEYLAKPIDVELLNPGLRLATTRHQAVYVDLKNAAEQWLSGLESCAFDRTCLGNVETDYQEKIATLRASCNCGYEDFAKLLAAAGPHRVIGHPALDPVYLPAWEAGLLRPDVSWKIKAWLVNVVATFRDLDSVPTLVAARRMALDEMVTKNKEPGNKGNTVRPSRIVPTQVLLDLPCLAALLELAEIVKAEGESTEQHERVTIGGQLSRSDEWKALLDKHEGDSRTVETVRTLRDVIRRHGKMNDNSDK